jgi:hypothetical protein
MLTTVTFEAVVLFEDVASGAGLQSVVRFTGVEATVTATRRLAGSAGAGAAAAARRRRERPPASAADEAAAAAAAANLRADPEGAAHEPVCVTAPLAIMCDVLNEPPDATSCVDEKVEASAAALCDELYTSMAAKLAMLPPRACVSKPLEFPALESTALVMALTSASSLAPSDERVSAFNPLPATTRPIVTERRFV